MDKVIKPVTWTTRATKDLHKTTKFYIDLYGKNKARGIASEIRQKTTGLEREDLDTLAIGAIDDAFTHLKYEYRKLLHHHVKITYRIGKSNIYIIRVFDTRQHPRKNK